MTPEERRLDLRRRQLAARQAQIRAQFPDAPGGVAVDSAAVSDFQGKLDSGFRAAMQGATFGLGDEIAGVRGALFGSTVDEGGAMARDMSGSMGERYARERDRERAANQAAQDANPSIYTGFNILGATVPAVMAAPLASGGSALGTAARGAAIGGAEGALHGAGNADGAPLAQAAGSGAAVGAGLGALAPAVVGGAAAARNAVKDPVTGVIDTMLNRANQNKANRAIANTISTSRKPPSQIMQDVMRAVQEGQPEFTMMDAMGVAGQRRASGITRAGGDAATEIAEFLESRQLGQGERVASFVDDAFDLSGGTARQARDTVKAGRDQAADIDFGSIRSNNEPVDIRNALALIDSKVAPFQAADIDSPARTALEKLRKQLQGGDDPSFELSNFDKVFAIRKELRDDISAAYRNGRNELAKDLEAVKRAMDDAMQASNPSYREAMDRFAASSRVMDAFEEGQQMSRPSQRAGDTTQRFTAMNPDEQAAARTGYGDSLMQRIEANTAPTANNAKPLQSMKRSQEIDAMAADPELLKRRLQREGNMWAVQNRALQGSRTADNLQDIASSGEETAGIMGAARSAMNLQLGDAAARLGGVLGPMAKGQNEATRELIARALMSRDPAKTLAPVIRQQTESQTKRRMLEALLRNAGREAALQ